MAVSPSTVISTFCPLLNTLRLHAFVTILYTLQKPEMFPVSLSTSYFMFCRYDAASFCISFDASILFSISID